MLHSGESEVVDRARKVLRHWNLPNSTDKPVKTVRFAVTRVDNSYRLICDAAAEPATYANAAILLRAIEMHAALALLDMYKLVTSVHAGLLRRGDRGVMIVGPSQSGKSTLSCAMWHAGWQLLADDVALIDCGAQTAVPLLRRVSVRHPSRELLGDDFWSRMSQVPSCDETEEGYVFHPDELTSVSRACSTPISAIVFLARNGSPQLAPAQSARIDAAQAMLALAPYTNQLEHGDMGNAMRRLAPLLNMVPAFDLARGPLDQMIAKIDHLTRKQ